MGKQLHAYICDTPQKLGKQVDHLKMIVKKQRMVKNESSLTVGTLDMHVLPCVTCNHFLPLAPRSLEVIIFP